VLRPIVGQGFEEPPATASASTVAESEVDRIRPEVADILGPAPIELDELVRQMGVSPSFLTAALLELELAGKVARHPGNRVSWA
jgi:DNA processing protein